MKRRLKICVLPGLAAANSEQDRCTALVMSGGGSNGAWESGVLWGLLHLGEP